MLRVDDHHKLYHTLGRELRWWVCYAAYLSFIAQGCGPPKVGMVDASALLRKVAVLKTCGFVSTLHASGRNALRAFERWPAVASWQLHWQSIRLVSHSAHWTCKDYRLGALLYRVEVELTASTLELAESLPR